MYLLDLTSATTIANAEADDTGNDEPAEMVNPAYKTLDEIDLFGDEEPSEMVNPAYQSRTEVAATSDKATSPPVDVSAVNSAASK